MSDPVIIGVHLCGAELRCAELRSSGSEVVLVRLERLPLGQASPAIRPESAQQGRNGGACTVVGNVPAPDVTSRYWLMPHASAAMTRQMVQHRIEADLPVPAEELVWGYRQATRSGADGTRGVLVQAARKDRIAAHSRGRPGRGAAVDVLSTEAEALYALWRYGLGTIDEEGAHVIVLASEQEWVIGVACGGLVRSIRRIRPSAGNLDSAYREAEQMIRSDTAGSALRGITWCGRGGEQVAGPLGTRVGVAVTCPMKAEGIRREEGGVDGETLGEYGLAIGLALAGTYERRQLIRLDGRFEQERSEPAEQVRKLLTYPWRWVGAAAGLVLLATVMHFWAIRSESSRMEAILATPTGGPEVANQREQKIRAMQRLDQYRLDVEGIVTSLAARLPANIVISSINISRERRLSIRGTAKDPKAIYTYADALRKSPRFGAVNPERTEQSGAFTITADLVGIEKLTSAQGGGTRWR